jgi:glycerol-3-phosphate dehydrogenase
MVYAFFKDDFRALTRFRSCRHFPLPDTCHEIQNQKRELKKRSVTMIQRVRYNALKHGAYSEATLLPGEDPADFRELHRGLIAEFAPNGRMEEETVASIARLMWRRQNLALFEIGQLSHFMAESLKKAAARERTSSKEDEELISEFKKLVEANVQAHKAEGDRKEETQAELAE